MKFAYLAVALPFVLFASICSAGSIPWMSDLQQAQQVAGAQQRLVMVHFTAQSCGPCRMLERGVYSRPEFQRALLANYIPVKVDVPSNPELVQRFQVRSWPTDVFLTAEGQVLFRDVSPQDLNRYISRVDQIAAHARVGMKPAVAAAHTQLPDRRSGIPTGPQNLAPVTQPRRPVERASQFVPPNQRPAFANPAPGNVAARPPVSNQYIPSQPATAQPPQVEQPQVAPIQNPYMPTQPEQPIQPEQPAVAAAVPAHQMDQVPANPGTAAAQEQQPVAKFQPDVTGEAKQPQLALEGFCPVALLENKSWTLGFAKWGHIHRGQLYLFSSEEAQAKFWGDPDRFSPVMSGYDIVQYLDDQRLQLGTRQFGSYYRNKYYLFASETTLLKFESAPDYYADKANLAIAEHDRAVMRR